MKLRVAPFILAAAVLAGTGTATAAPPEPIEGTFQWPCPDFVADLTVSGKSGLISLPGGKFKYIAPNQRVTITNTETGEAVSYLITGVTHVATQTDKSFAVTATGPNVVLVPEVLVPEDKKHDPGLFFTRGTVNWTLNPDGTERTLFTSGGGQVTDVCELLE